MKFGPWDSTIVKIGNSWYINVPKPTMKRILAKYRKAELKKRPVVVREMDIE